MISINEVNLKDFGFYLDSFSFNFRQEKSEEEERTLREFAKKVGHDFYFFAKKYVFFCFRSETIANGPRRRLVTKISPIRQRRSITVLVTRSSITSGS